MLKNLRNVEFSKRLLAFIEVLVLLCFCLVAASVLMGDSSPLTALITGVFTLASIGFGFYFWKARSENIRKYAKNLNHDQIEQMVKLAQILMNDNETSDDFEDDLPIGGKP